MAPAPQPSPQGGSTNMASVAIGVGVGVGVTLLLVLFVAIGFIIWRRHKRAYDRKPGELVASTPDYSIRTPVPFPRLPKRVRRESVQNESERRGLLRPSSENQRLPAWEQRHTFPPLSPPHSLHDIPMEDTPLPIYHPRPAAGRHPVPGTSIDSAGQVFRRPVVESPESLRILTRQSLPSPSVIQPRPSTAKRTAPASLPPPSITSDISIPEYTRPRSEQFIDLATRPDLLPPSFLPRPLCSEQSSPSSTKAVSLETVGQGRQDATTVAGLGKFSSEWRESALMPSSPRSAAASTLSNLTPLTIADSRTQLDRRGNRPMHMEMTKDKTCHSDDRRRVQSSASTTGSLSTGSVSSEGDREIRTQLHQPFRFPVPQPLATSREVQRHRPNPTPSFPVSPPLTAAVEGVGRRT